MRIVSGGFFKKWEDYSVEEKINNKEFKRALEHMRSNQCSVYKGDGSEAFSQRIVAASCIAAGHVQAKEVFVLRTKNGCLMILEEYGNLGIDSVDRYHYNLVGVSQDELLKIFDSVVSDDVHRVIESYIYPILVQFEKNDSSLKSRYTSKFSSNTLIKLEECGGGPY